MEIISFDIVGKQAHFRKFYSNSTALSFTIPPRTTIMGMIANIMGIERDSYYNDFASDKIRISLGVKSKLKKTIHRLNYLKIESHKDLKGRKGRTQIPVEIISGHDMRKDDVSYRIYLSYHNKGKNIFNIIKALLLTKTPIYNLSLGAANLSASLQNICFYDDRFIKELDSNKELVNFDSAVISDERIQLKMDTETQTNYEFLEEELMPADFKANFDREVIKMNRLLYTTGNLTLPLIYKGKYYQITTQSGIENIQFWD